MTKRKTISVIFFIIIILLLMLLYDYKKSEASSNLLFTRIISGYEIYNIRDEKDTNPIVVPEFYNGLPVVALGTSAFQDSQATSITFEKPENIRFIEIDAFKNTKATNSISLPNIKSIPSMAFYNSNFSEIHLSDNVERIGANAFNGAKAINKIDLLGVDKIQLKSFYNSNFEYINLDWNKVSYIGSNAFNKQPVIELSHYGNISTSSKSVYNELNLMMKVNTQVALEKLEYQWSKDGMVSEKNWILSENNVIISPSTDEYEGDYYLHVQSSPVKASELNSVYLRTSRFSFDNIKPSKPIMKASTSELTNRDVVISTTFSIDSVIKEYKIADGNWLKYNGNLIINENTEIYTRSFDSAGNISEISSIKIDNIDKTSPNKPTINTSTIKPTNENIIVNINYDKDSFIKEYRVGAGSWTLYDGSDLIIEENTIIYARAFDEAGNLSEVNIVTINNIDKDSPDEPIIHVLEINKSIFVSVDYSSDSFLKKVKIGNGDWVNYTEPIEIFKNTIIYAKGIDLAGNSSDIKIELIDSFVEIKLEKIYIDYYNEGAFVHFEFPENIIDKKYNLDDGVWINYDGIIDVKENVVIYLEKTDKDGNTTYSEYEIIVNPNKRNEIAKIELMEGDFKLKTSNVKSFGNTKITAEKQIITTGFENDFGVIDARGTQDGWKLNISATPFTVKTFEGFIGKPYQLPGSSLTLKKPMSLSQVGKVHNSQLPDIMLYDEIAIDGDNRYSNLLEAIKYKGMGEFSFVFDKEALSLTIDAVTARVDTVNYPNQMTPYESTITWDLINSP